jgi:nucleoid-associated protein YgaU
LVPAYLAAVEREFAMLLDGRGDLIAAALTDTEERRRSIDFSVTYFQDGQRLLVRQDSKIADVCDLDGQAVAVTAGSTAVDNIRRRAGECAIAVELLTLENPAAALVALETGQAAAYATDGIALEHFAADRPFKVVGNHFSSAPYGVGLAQGDARLHRLVDLTLQAMYNDGTLAQIYRKWFGDSRKPYPIDIHIDTTAGAGSDAADPQLLELAGLQPDAAGDQAAPAADNNATQTAPRSYRVASGDTLSIIAGKVYGDVSPNAWQRIYRANQAAIGANPANLRVGMELTIPE